MIITKVADLLAGWANYIEGAPKHYKPDDGGRRGQRSGLSSDGQCWLRVCGQKDYKVYEPKLKARYGRFGRVVCSDLDAWINTLASDLLRVPLSVSTTDDLDDTLPPTKWRKGGRK